MITQVIDNFLDKEETKFLINYYNSNESKTFVFGNTYPLDLPIKNINQDFNFLIKKLNTNAKKINNSEIDWFQIVRWGISTGQPLHFDTASNQTTLSSILYLNDDFQGGETYYKDGSLFSPVTGRILYFDGNYYKHGVKPITKGTRYTVATWYKKENAC